MIRFLLFIGLLSAFFFWMTPPFKAETPQGRVLRINMTQAPTTLDPRKASDQFDGALQYHFYEGLTRVTRESTAALGCASKIEVSDDQKTYRFTLKEAFWSNQEPVTAYDFEYSWKTSIHPQFFCPNAHLFYTIKNGEQVKMGLKGVEEFGVKAIDAKTLEVNLEHPTPHFLHMLSFLVFSPIPKNIAEKNSNWAKSNLSPPANGPFFCSNFKPNEKIILKKNPFYWAKDEVNPDEIDVLLISDHSTALNLYEQKELDLIGDPFTSIPLDSLTSLKADHVLHQKNLAFSLFTTFNVNAFPFNNVHIRKAFSFAIDREAIVENIMQNGEQPANSFIPPVLKAPHFNLNFFNPEMARKELALGMKELNIASLGALVYHYPAIGYNDRIAQTLQENFRDILKISIQIERVERKTFLNLLQKKEYQFAQFSWMAMYNDPHAILERFKHRKNFRNYPGWKNQQFTDKLNLFENTFDSNLRNLYVEQAENILLEEVPLTPIFHGSYIYMEQPNIRGFHISPTGSPHLQWIEFTNE